MSKNEVLTQVYPDEIDYIFDKKREKELKRYMGYLNNIMAVSAGFGGGDSAEEYVQDIMDKIRKLSNSKQNKENKNREITKEDIKKNTERLKFKEKLYEQMGPGKKVPEELK